MPYRPLPPSRRMPWLLLLASLPLAAQAAEPTELSPLDIKGQASSTSLTPSASQVRERLARVPGGTNLSEPQQETRLASLRDALDYQPGVVIQEFFGGTDQPRLNIRGSGIQSNPVNRGVLLLQDGLPLNEADGSFVISLLEPRNASHISVRRGANAGSPGATSLGGELDFQSLTGADERAHLRLEGGSFGRYGQQLAGGLQQGDLDARVSLSNDSYDGYRHHSNSRRTLLQSNFGFRRGEDFDNRTYLNWGTLKFNIPNVITKARLKSEPRSVLGDGTTPQDNLLNIYRRDPHRETEQLRIANRSRWGDEQLNQTFGIYAQNTDDTFVDPLSHTVTDTDTVGAQWQLQGRAEHFDYRLASSWSQSDMDRKLYANNPQNGSRYSATPFATLDLQARNLDLQLGLDWHLASQWLLVTELKWSQVSRDAGNLRQPSQGQSSRQRLDQQWNYTTPKVGLVWTPSPQVRLYANLSRSHEAPTFWEIVTSTVAANNPASASSDLVKLDVQRGTTLELGGNGSLLANGGLDWALSVYQSRIDDELISTTDSLGVKVGTYNYASRTRHRGIEAGLNGSQPLPALLLDGETALDWRMSWTFSDFRFQGGEYSGNRIAGVPRHLLNGELLLRSGPLRFGPNLRWVPQDSPTDHANTRNNYQDAYALWGLKLDYQVREGFSVYLQGDNLTDKTYASTFVIRNRADASQPTFLSGSGRSLSAGLNYSF
ncbi:TonB-dependent receptor [Pseudomonas sp. ABC1]|nr:TonB-dependent receptor [Pseudomonas sp. ABC1]